MYQVRKTAKSEFIPIRNLSYHVQVWGEPAPGKIPLVLVHGWMDVAASYQFMVDALEGDHYIIAPDWRGFGKTQCRDADCFWFPDYLADLDFLLDHFAPTGQVNLVGHSMGGNVAMVYGGVRPERIRRLVNLEGFGMPATTAAQAPPHFAKWMDELKAFHRGETQLKPYENLEGVARRLMKTNSRLSLDKAIWLSRHWAEENIQGQWEIQGHTAHKIVSAMIHRAEEVNAAWARLTMPVLAVEASDDSLNYWYKGRYTLAEYHERIKIVPNLQIGRIENAGHMLHHDQPEELAKMIEHFIA